MSHRFVISPPPSHFWPTQALSETLQDNQGCEYDFVVARIDVKKTTSAVPSGIGGAVDSRMCPMHGSKVRHVEKCHHTLRINTRKAWWPGRCSTISFYVVIELLLSFINHVKPLKIVLSNLHRPKNEKLRTWDKAKKCVPMLN